jgi:hypothetical protein
MLPCGAPETKPKAPSCNRAQKMRIKTQEEKEHECNTQYR